MSSSLLAELPYYPDSALLFDRIADEPWAIFLDSRSDCDMAGRYDMLSAAPYQTLTNRGNITEIANRTGSRFSLDDPFQLLQQALQPFTLVDDSLPFCGGAMGYFSYDLARRLENIPSIAENRESLPEMALGLYDWAVIVDHEKQRSWLTGTGRDAATAALWPELLERFGTKVQPIERPPFRVLQPVTSNMDRARYANAFERIKRYIQEGDCYQVNLAQCFETAAEGHPWLAYCALRQSNPAPFSAYLNTPYGQILSASPERFLKVREGQVETRPIKGTRPRGADPEQDAVLAEDLLTSAKDRAENLMIVDLLRNDLGKVCLPGSVRADKLFKLESYATVHHLVSTVTGQLAPGKDPSDLLRACFPGGSITGAPKLRAMEIIEELEPHRRGVYCGSIGYLGFNGSMDTSIAIRTLVHTNGQVHFWAGGGIVDDSVMDDELRESFDKAAAFLALLEQFRR
ncbi:MAG: aminodeoxychorismate synthase component I [Sulfuricellaceae bacterium]|nr:aminodeoxychorismate synthase component I [Sulfuricellaceae bacterium]